MLSLETRFERLTTPIASIRPSFDQLNSGLGVTARYDSRDNLFTPNHGQEATVSATFFDTAFGGDRDYQNVETELLSYHSMFSDKLVVGLRAGARFTFGRAPFYTNPYVRLRGIPGLRFQDEKAGEAEFELRWDLYKRWSAMGFFGVGWLSGPASDRDDPGAIPAGGIGLRYLIARKLGLRVGLDVGFSRVDQIVYVQTGSAW